MSGITSPSIVRPMRSSCAVRRLALATQFGGLFGETQRFGVVALDRLQHRQVRNRASGVSLNSIARSVALYDSLNLPWW